MADYHVAQIKTTSTSAKPGVALLLELQAILRTDGPSVAHDFIQEIFRDNDTLPSFWFGSGTDEILASVLSLNIQILSEERQLLKDTWAIGFTTALIFLACRDLYTEKQAGPNRDTLRFHSILRRCVDYWTPSQAAICWWILSQNSPSETSCDCILDCVRDRWHDQIGLGSSIEETFVRALRQEDLDEEWWNTPSGLWLVEQSATRRYLRWWWMIYAIIQVALMILKAFEYKRIK